MKRRTEFLSIDGSDHHLSQAIMTIFSPENVKKAIARLKTQSTQDVKNVRAQAVKLNITELIEACDFELGKRPSLGITGDQAIDFDRMAEQVENLDLTSTIRVAFTKVQPPSPEEVRVLRWIAAHPGGLFSDAEKAHGKRDLGLVVGHLVYERYGCFRRFVNPKDQSSVLIEKTRSKGPVRYTLKAEAHAAFSEIGVI